MKLSQEALNKIRVAVEYGKDKDIQHAVDEALGEINAKRHWQEEVGEWIAFGHGFWHVRECYKELGALSTKDMCAIRVAVNFHKNEGVIEPWEGRGYGWWRKKERELADLDWRNADENPLDIKLPLGLDKMVNLHNGDIFIIAGESDAGKTSMCLNIAEMNMDKECHYFSSELGAAKIKQRISLFETPQELWNTFFHYRHSNYQDVLFPNSINIIDFIIQTENFWEMGTKLKNIHLALKDIESGMAIVAIQKSPYKEFGRGGDITLELASLYITLSRKNEAKILKLKDWKVESNPNSKICSYKLVNASKFIQQTPWYYKEDEEDATQAGGSWWKK